MNTVTLYFFLEGQIFLHKKLAHLRFLPRGFQSSSHQSQLYHPNPPPTLPPAGPGCESDGGWEGGGHLRPPHRREAGARPLNGSSHSRITIHKQFRVSQKKGIIFAPLIPMGRVGGQEFKTTAKDNTADPVWDEEFEVDIFPHQFLHAYVKVSLWLGGGRRGGGNTDPTPPPPPPKKTPETHFYCASPGPHPDLGAKTHPLHQPTYLLRAHAHTSRRTRAAEP